MKTKDLPGAADLLYDYDAASNLTSSTDAGGTSSFAYNKSNELDRMTEPLPLGRTNLFAYNSLGLREHTWNGAIGGGTYNGNSFVAPSAFVIHTVQQYDSAGKLLRIKTTRGSSDADANRLSDLSYSYTVPATTSCLKAEAGKKTGLTSRQEANVDQTQIATTLQARNRTGLATRKHLRLTD